jgi:signal transduction histidine kinase
MTLSLFDRLFKTSGSIQHTLRSVEWTILVCYCLLLLVAPTAADGLKSPKIVVVISMIMLSVLSWIFPIDRPQWQQRIYIGAELVPILVSRLGNWGLELSLWLVILKSCFLLDRRDAIVTTIISGIGWLIPLAWLIPINNQIREQIAIDSHRDYIFFYQYFTEILSYVAVSTFVSLFGFLLIREYRSQQQIKLLNQEVETLGTLLERTRIARNIHDTLGHTLTALGIQLEVAQQIYLSHPEKTGRRLDTAKQLTDQCLQDIRTVVRTLRQANFDLTQGLKGLMMHLQQTQPIATQIRLNLPPLPLQTSYQIYYIIQEGITNIQKHADASHVCLRSSSTAEFLTIELSDNGHGFDTTQPTAGFGFQGMRERLQLIGGSLHIDSSQTQGTQLRLKIPSYPDTSLS